MSHSSPSGQTRLNFHSAPHTAANAARSSIMNSSAHGWSPLKIAKRDSPLKPSPNMSDDPTSPDGLQALPRRTSSSFKHVTKNSLVSNSPFKQTLSPSGLTSAEERVIHERAGRRAMGEAPATASGVASTPRANIGLGISANARPRSTSRSASGSGSGSAVAGTRKVSTERPRVAFPTIAGERRVSGERVVSGSKENESPDIRSGKRVPRQSFGLKGLAKNEYVSKSPFRRSPSGGLSNAGSSRANESPTNPTPRSIPVEKDDIFSSPSPSPAARRRSSPSKFLARNTSPTPSPPRGIAQPTLGSGVSPSPLGQMPSLAPASYAEPSPSPTPVKSSMTPSRRLRGPRDFGNDIYDSPTKSNKTVTFQTVPDVKEFERMSVEGATPDGSFELEATDEEEWADENADNDNSLEEILLEPDSLDKAMNRQQYRIANPDMPVMDPSEDGHEGIGDESATAEFMDTLIEEGLFSPPEVAADTFGDYPHIDLGGSQPAPFLSTPSLGDSVHATPLLAGVEPDQMYADTDGAGVPYGRTHHAERNMRAHSEEMQHDEPIPHPASLPHSREGDQRMLLNANAAQPALPHSPEQQKKAPLAHQDGPMPDPFITLQTATNVLSPPRNETREEGGVPLGRTSHVERMQAARMLATQSLGLGMPRSPAVTNDLTGANSKTFQDAPIISPSPSPSPEDEDVDSEMLFDASFELGNDGTTSRKVSDAPPSRLPGLQAMIDQEEKEMTADPAASRRLPKPPKVAEIKLPSPVTSPSKREDAPAPVQQETKKGGMFDFSKGFSLPSIGITSPLVVTSPSMLDAPPAPASESGSEIDDDDNEKEEVLQLTPPRAVGIEKKQDSPHRIPSFDFGDLKFETEKPEDSETKPVEAVKPSAAPSSRASMPVLPKPAPIVSPIARPKSITIEASGPVRPAGSPARSSPLSRKTGSELGPQPSSPLSRKTGSDMGPQTTQGQSQASGSTSTKVRQRISREMIRETIQQRLADGTLSRHSSSASGHILDAEIPKRRPVSISTEKALPPPPPKTPVLGNTGSVPMSKAHTTEAVPRQASSTLHVDRPLLRPRSKTQSAEEVIQSNVKDGFINEPKSALDKLMDGMNNIVISTPPDKIKAVLAKPISILQRPKDTTSIPPSPSHMTAPVSAVGKPSPSPSNSNRNAGNSPVASKGKARQSGITPVEAKPARRKGRRSMSTGDVGEEADAAKHHGRSVATQPRLTLGLKDHESMLDAFRDETDGIGNDRRYKVREKKVAGAKYDGDKVGHNKAGDIDSGASRAWRQLRRPSDMNEHAAALRRLRIKEATDGKSSGTIFVKVLGVESLNIPLPDQETFFCVTLDNGIDYIRTPYIVLKDGARVNQEFSLVEHANFEFSLSLDVRKDPHILKAVHEKSGNPINRPASLLPLSGRETPSSPHRGIRALFGSSRRARPRSEQTGPTGAGSFISASTNSRANTPLPMAAPPKETIARYLMDEKSPTIGKTHIAFAPIAKNCQAKVLEMRYPVFAMFKSGPIDQGPRARGSSHQPAQVLGEETHRPMIGKITLQIFRLPPLPGLKQDDLPQCIEEALRGMRHHAWHEHEYHEGVLTQDGGDCSNPKRRMFKLIGGSLVAINEVTKKQVTSIDLRQATAVIDINDPKQAATSQRHKRGSDEGLEVRAKSFLIEFKDGEGIIFSADKDEDKALWLETLNGLIGKIPSNPLWAELLAAHKREQETAASMTGKKVRKAGSSTSLKSKRSASGLPRSTSGLKRKEKPVPA